MQKDHTTTLRLTRTLGAILAFCSVSGLAQAQYLVVSSDRQEIKVSSKACPNFDKGWEQFKSKEAAQQAYKQALAPKEGRGGRLAWHASPGEVAVVYQYLGTSSQFPHCRFTRYGVVTGRNLKDVFRRMELKPKEYPREYLGAPSALYIWPPQ